MGAAAASRRRAARCGTSACAPDLRALRVLRGWIRGRDRSVTIKIQLHLGLEETTSW